MSRWLVRWYFVTMPDTCSVFTDLEMKEADQLLWPQYGV